LEFISNHFPDSAAQEILFTDASDVAIGGALVQLVPSNFSTLLSCVPLNPPTAWSLGREGEEVEATKLTTTT
jgi:hypothetical protein